MIKICHETPKALFKEAKKFNDYDYYLDYLWEDKEYCNFFREQLKVGRTVIMDSSLFEFHPIVPPIERFFDHVVDFGEYGNTIEYIVTDVLNDAERTMYNFDDWSYKYHGKCPGISIGVAQGATIKELRDCYAYMTEHADKVAIPFDSKAFDELLSEEEKEDRLYGWAVGRQRFIRDLIVDNLWVKKPTHLLGCSYAWEFNNPLYQDVIESLDTSNPVVCGIKNIKYTTLGNDQKPSIKLCDLIDYVPSSEEEKLIISNVEKFRELVNG